jgi:asparagine synthase (glutamine-hydrolysing)
MGDFFLDLRPAGVSTPAASRAAQLLAFCEDSRCVTFENAWCRFVVSRVDDRETWAPCEYTTETGKVLVALAGRVALEESEWLAPTAAEITGGRACSILLTRYLAEGVGMASRLNGNFCIFIADERARTCHIITDRSGMLLCYGAKDENAVFSSHPDILADALGENENLDLASLGEFLAAGRISFPYTYYQRVRALQPGAIHTLQAGQDGWNRSTQSFFSFNFRVDPAVPEEDLARDLAAAFKKAVQRRSLPRFGTLGIGLSGGLDSRAILSCIPNRSHVRAFTLFDEENEEFRVASSIARACNVDLIPIRRDPEHYGAWAEAGVRISGATGCIRSNHYLGVRQTLREIGVRNFLTGCYCDYVFKALALNTRESRFLRVQQLDGCRPEHYLPCYELKHAPEPVHHRLRAASEALLNGSASEAQWLEIERRRTFPLAYEGDSAMRLIPQRVLPWFLPICDNDILDVYLRTPSRFKLNSSIFRKMLTHVCAPEVLRIVDNNTGAGVNAGLLTRTVRRYQTALTNRLEKSMKPRIALRGSWPNWEFYVHHSPVVHTSWSRPSDFATAVLSQVVGENLLARPIQSFRGRSVEFFTRVWTLKLWLEQRDLTRSSQPVRSSP